VYEIIFHGRGGQGALLAARILANAYFFEGRYIEAFPHFGGERRGAPVRAFLRIDDQPIRVKSPIQTADCTFILDGSLLAVVDIASNFKQEGIIILNSPLKPAEIKLKELYNLAVCDATGISWKILKKNIPNSAILGAYASVVKLNFDSLKKAFQEIFKNDKAAKINIEMAELAYNSTTMGRSSIEGNKEKETRLPDKFDRSFETGGIYKADGSSRVNKTSSWTTKRAVIDMSKCSSCLLCYVLCPDVCIKREGKKLKVEEDYCKGCGICEQICPREAISLNEKVIDR